MDPKRKIAITGGPCGGKSSGMSYVSQKLANIGYKVAVVPEVATMLFGNGLAPGPLLALPSRERYFRLEGLLLETQLHLEDTFARGLAIHGNEDPLLLCDRGTMDVKAYMSPEEWELLLETKKLTTVELRDKRYGMVAHLLTVADGREEFYTTENNPARQERTPAEARASDQRTRMAWLGHPHLRVIDNSTLFQGKLRKLLKEIQRYLGIPVVLEIERKFRVDTPFSPSSIPVPYVPVEIEQAYLKNGGRIRKRSQNGGSVYFQTFKIPSSRLIASEEREEQIEALKFHELMRTERDPLRDVIKKIRLCFLWKHQYFELDVFMAPERLRGRVTLELELTEERTRVHLPKWLGKLTEVTEDPSYKNFNMAEKPLSEFFP